MGSLKGIGGMLLKMAAAFVSEATVKHLVISALDYYVGAYERSAAKTADPSDDIKARKLRQLLVTVSKQWQ